MAEQSNTKIPAIDAWVDEPSGRWSKWDGLVEQVLAQPGDQWARIERPEPWNSAFPAWFRKKYTDVELYVPPSAPKGVEEARKWMFLRRKPLAPSPVDKR